MNPFVKADMAVKYLMVANGKFSSGDFIGAIKEYSKNIGIIPLSFSGYYNKWIKTCSVTDKFSLTDFN